MRRLTLSDFRCFKGKHSWDIGGSQERAVWCINGPNGAGKSTICDALRYLLDRSCQGDLDDIAEGRQLCRVSAIIMGLEIEKTLETHVEQSGRKVAKSSYRLDGRPTTHISEDDIPSVNHIAQNGLSDIVNPSEIDLPAAKAFAELSNGRHVIFENGKRDVVFGRHKSCDVLVTSSSVSTRHCRLKRPREPGAAWLVHDFGSTNGTMLNGKRMKGQNVAPVNHGDVIRFGDMSMTFKQADPRRDVSTIFQELLREPTDAQMTDFLPAKKNNSLTWTKDELIVTIDGRKRSLATFSSGERAIVVLSCLLARHRAKDTPFCVMDEVDAKLDPKRRMALQYFLKNHPKAPRYTLMVSHTLGVQNKELELRAL